MSFPFLNCPSCGAMLELKYHHSKMVVCGYCGQTSFINANSLTAVGTPILLADYGSVVAVGKRGKIKGKSFEVLGRLRFDYEDGFWDEWLVRFGSDAEETQCWLQEDEGEFTLFREQNLPISATYNDFQVGTATTIANHTVFITEKNTAVVNGGEGELPFQVIAGEKADFVDGIVSGKKLTFSLEYMPKETVFNMGEPMISSDFEWG